MKLHQVSSSELRIYGIKALTEDYHFSPRVRTRTRSVVRIVTTVLSAELQRDSRRSHGHYFHDAYYWWHRVVWLQGGGVKY